jgi:hypothetical protein
VRRQVSAGIVAEHDIKLMDGISASVDRISSPEAKIALFRSLFRGRDDVYQYLLAVPIEWAD